MSRIHILLNKFALGTCTRAEFDELMCLLQQGGKEQEIQHGLRSFYDTLETEIISQTSVNQQGDIVQQDEQEGFIKDGAKSSFSRKKWIMAASVLLCIAVTGWAIFFDNPFRPHNDEKQMSRIFTPAGSKTSVVLPDGTTVWLNSNSTLTYTTGFVDGKREVTLIGEAMFDVIHDSLHPFLVHTRNFDVTDLGTVFNIQAYPEDKKAEASLITGSIEISLKKAHTKKIVLEPNHRLTIQNEQVVITNENEQQPDVMPIIADPQTRVAPDTAWKVNKLIFRDKPFNELAMQMQRRYNVEISFENDKLSQFKFTGRFEDESVEEALEELQIIAPFTYKKEKNKVYITK